MNTFLQLILDGRSIEVSNSLNAIRNYTNMSFATPYGVRKQPLDILDTGVIRYHSTATSNVPFTMLFRQGDCIEFVYSVNNPFIYFVDEVDVNHIKIYNPETIMPEFTYCSLVKLNFRGVSCQDVTALINYKEDSVSNGNLKKHTLDGYSYEFNTQYASDNSSGYPLTLMNTFNIYKRLPKSRRREYILYGYV